jgi:hypothetical protein
MAVGFLQLIGGSTKMLIHLLWGLASILMIVASWGNPKHTTIWVVGVIYAAINLNEERLKGSKYDY